MGQLARGEVKWEVYVEILTGDLGQVRGRVHFTMGDRHRESAWIFLERTDRDVVTRFNEFSAVELWNLLEALGP